jgi:NDP-sugar pyrophosphorylase family protein
MALKRKKETVGRGVAFLDGTRVTKFIEKPAQDAKLEDMSNLTNAGKYILNTKVLDLLPNKKHFSFEEDFLQNSASKINLQGYMTRARSFSIDTPEKLARARKNW